MGFETFEAQVVLTSLKSGRLRKRSRDAEVPD